MLHMKQRHHKRSVQRVCFYGKERYEEEHKDKINESIKQNQENKVGNACLEGVCVNPKP